MHNIRHFCVPSHFLLKTPCEQILFSSVTSLEKCSLEGAVLTQLWLAELGFNPKSPQLQRLPPSTTMQHCLFSQNILVFEALKSGVWGLCMCSVAKLCPTQRLHGLQLTRLLSMGFPKKNTGVGCHFLVQGIFLTQGSNPCLLHWQLDSLPLRHPRSLGDCGQFREKFLKQPLAWVGLASPTILSTSLIPQAPFLFLFKAANIWGQVVTLLHVLVFFLFLASGSSCHLFKNLQLRVLKLLEKL